MAIVRTKLSDGQELLIETREPVLVQADADEYSDEYRDTPKVIQKVVESAQDLFGEALNNIQKCAREITAKFDGMEEKIRPDEIEASLAFKLTAEAGVVLTSVGGEAQLEVKLIWKRARAASANE